MKVFLSAVLILSLTAPAMACHGHRSTGTPNRSTAQSPQNNSQNSSQYAHHHSKKPAVNSAPVATPENSRAETTPAKVADDTPPTDPLPSREWTDAAGSVVAEARYIGIIDGQVAMRDASGKMLLMSATSLSTADQEYVASHAAPSTASAMSDARLAQN